MITANILSLFYQTNEIMTKQEFIAYRKQKQNELYEWAVEMFGSWEEFIKFAFVDGKEFVLPVNVIPPSTHYEWENAKAGGSYTEGPIEVENSWVRGFSIMDGHNRFKTAVANGQTEIRVIFRS